MTWSKLGGDALGMSRTSEAANEGSAPSEPFQVISSWSWLSESQERAGLTRI